MNTDIFDLYKLMERDYVLLAFKGSITSELLSSVFQIMESKMEDLQDSLKSEKEYSMYWLNVCRICIITLMNLR